MKKIMALCLAAIMVFSIFSMPAMAATITVPATTVVDQSFAGLSAETFPSDWTITGNGHKFLENGINPGHHVNVGATGVGYNNSFDAGKADYKFTVNFAHYNNTQYIHFGADSVANASKHGVADTGYTFTADMGSGGKGGVYKLYKNGEQMNVTLTDSNSNGWDYQKVREFAFEVTADELIITGPFVGSPVTVADSEPVKSGYVGAGIACNAASSVPLLNAMKLVTREYSYDVTTDETNTGAYVVLGTEYKESHEGNLWYSQSLAGLTADTVPADISIPSTSVTYQTDFIQLTAFKNPKVNFGTRSVDDGASFVVEAKYSATNESNKVQFEFLGYQLRSGKNDGGFKLYQGDTLLDSKDTSSFATWGNGSLNKVKVMFDSVTSTMDVYVDNTLVFENVAIENPTYTGTLSILNNYSGTTYIYYVKMYSSDYRDTSSYVDITRSDFLFERDFSVNDATIDELRNQNFAISGDGINEEGLYKNEGTASAEYTGHKFKGAYTLETRETGDYKNPGIIVFNKTADGDYYCLDTKGASWSFYKMQGGVKTILEDNTTTEASDDKAFYANPRITKVSLFPSSDNATLDIKVVLNGKEVVTVTDTTPITKAGTFKVTTGYNKPSTLDYIKVYPNGTNPTYTASFVVDGTETADFAKGNTLLKFPTAMIGQKPAIVAALYENDEMTDVKIIDVDALNIGVAELFDTTGSTAANASIKVFVWNSIEGMAPILDPFVLD